MSNPNLHNPQLDGAPFFWEAGPVGILLSHGYTATTVEVRPLAEALHGRGYTVAAPLLPGHGSHPAELNRVTWQDWVQAGEQLYQQLAAKCRQVFVGGESMGALVALYLASQHAEIAGVLCYAPAIRLTLSRLDVLKLHLAAPFLAQVGRTSLDRADRWQGYPGLPLKGALQLIRFQKAVKERLPRIHQPIVVFQGLLDTTVHPIAGDILLNGVSSTLKAQHWMEKSTHVITLDQEVPQVAELTTAFIEKALSAQTS